MPRTNRLTTLVPALIAVGAVAAVGLGPTVLAQDINPIDEGAALLADELNTIEVIDRFGPSVVAVNIAVRGEPVTPPTGSRDEEGFQPFQEFFGNEAPVQRSNGSGFLIEFEQEPFLVTNFHVVEGALESETATALDGAEISVNFAAQPQTDVIVDVVGVNPSFDLALLQLQDEADLPAAPALSVADSDGLAVGQKTIAIGNPFGLASTVTSGIVSAIDRFIPTIGQVPVPMIQTDAAINPGNSGGPLLDSRGRLIGINTALINPQGRSFAGLGFAVPSNLLTESLANLELGGVTDVSDTRPRLGIAAQSLEFLPSGIRAELGLPDEGVAIIEVQAGSVADKAGLVGSTETISLDDDFDLPAPGDTIVAIDGEPIDSVEDITMKVTYESQAGDELDFTVVRDGIEISVAVTLEVTAANTVEVAG